MVFAKTTLIKEHPMCHYHHLTLIEREKIMFFRAQGKNLSVIAKELGRSKATISRELRRNGSDTLYIPAMAHKQYRTRRKKCRPHKKLDTPDLLALVKDKFIKHQWSPEEIAGRLRLEKHCASISYATIYRGIYAGMFDEAKRSRGARGAARNLRHKGKTRHKKGHEERRGKIRISNELSARPRAANHRRRLGDWEGDTVAGKTGRACLVTRVDRKSRFATGGKADKKNACEVNRVMIRALQGLPVKTITPDRGKEFARHAEVTSVLQAPFYFPEPHQPWQRGTNENTNGLLREYFPKGQDLTDISEDHIQEVFDELNKRPRKCLGYRTPYEVFYKKKLHLT